MSLTRYLARCSGLEDAETRAAMQSSKSLVINTLYLLRLVHQAAGERDLAVLNKLRDQVLQIRSLSFLRNFRDT